MDWTTVKDLVTTIVGVATLFFTATKEWPRVQKMWRKRTAARRVRRPPAASPGDTQPSGTTASQGEQPDSSPEKEVPQEDLFADRIPLYIISISFLLAGPVASALWVALAPADYFMGMVLGAAAFVLAAEIFTLVFDLSFCALNPSRANAEGGNSFLYGVTHWYQNYAKTLFLMSASIGGLWGLATVGLRSTLGGTSYSSGLWCGGGWFMLVALTLLGTYWEEREARQRMQALLIHDITLPSPPDSTRSPMDASSYVCWMEEVAAGHFEHFGVLQPTLDLGAQWIPRTHAIEYLTATCTDEPMEIRTWVPAGRGKSLMMMYSFHRKSDGMTIARAESEWQLVRANDMTDLEIPKAIRKLIVVMPAEPAKRRDSESQRPRLGE